MATDLFDKLEVESDESLDGDGNREGEVKGQDGEGDLEEVDIQEDGEC